MSAINCLTASIDTGGESSWVWYKNNKKQIVRDDKENNSKRRNVILAFKFEGFQAWSNLHTKRIPVEHNEPGHITK